MSRGRNYTVGERAVIAIGAAAGKTVAEVNAVLEAGAKHTGGTFRPVNATSMGMAPRYPSLSRDYAEGLWDHITRPKALSEPHAPTLDPAVLAEERLAALLELETENTTLRAKLEAAQRERDHFREAWAKVQVRLDCGVDATEAVREERADVVAYLRGLAGDAAGRMFVPLSRVKAYLAAADTVERGEHRCTGEDK